MVKPWPEPPERREPREADRLLRPQPPAPIPPRVQVSTDTGLLAHTLLGNQVVK